MKLIREGSCSIYAPAGKISKKLPVFYNPEMKTNRDICVLLLKSLKMQFNAADVLAGTGIRSIRLLKELSSTKIKSISINDNNPDAASLIKNNLKLNMIKSKKVSVHNQDANEFLIKSEGFNYIDIDPFGTPNPFLDAAIKRIARQGILAVTATDTSALAGTYPLACLRKYWARPLRNELMHEIGIRILIRKVQLVGAQYDKSLIPIYCHSTKHYVRVYFSCKKSKTEVNKMLKQHGMFENAGPLWLGRLWDTGLAAKMCKNLRTDDKDLHKLVYTIKNESKIPVLGFYSIPKLCKKLKVPPPKQDVLIQKIKKKSKVAQTHFAPNAIRTSLGLEKIKKIILSL